MWCLLFGAPCWLAVFVVCCVAFVVWCVLSVVCWWRVSCCLSLVVSECCWLLALCGVAGLFAVAVRCLLIVFRYCLLCVVV